MNKVNAKTLLTLGDGRHIIEPNLYLVVRSNGKNRNYVLRYTIHGRRRDMSLGSPEIKTLTTVKAEATKFKAMIASGIDPLDVKEEKREEAHFKQINPTFCKYAEQSFDEIFALKQFKRKAEEKRMMSLLRKWAYPVIGHRKIHTIKSIDVVEVLKQIWDTQTVTAVRLASAIRTVFSLAIRDGVYEGINPASYEDCIRTYLPSISKIHTTKHRQAPSLLRLQKDVETLLSKHEYYMDVRMAIVFLAVSALRRNEVVELNWSEVDLENKTIYIRPERRKDGKKEPFAVPISTQMEWILRHQMPKERGRVFRSKFEFDDLDVSLKGTSVSRFLQNFTLGDWTLHGLRSTFREWAIENDVNYVVAERCLMHNTGGAVYQAYQRSDLLEMRRPVMQQYADIVCPMSIMEAYDAQII